MDVQPVTLQGSAVRLEPLTLGHLPGLVLVGLDPELWRWIPTNVKNAEDMRAYVDRALDEDKMRSETELLREALIGGVSRGLLEA